MTNPTLNQRIPLRRRSRPRNPLSQMTKSNAELKNSVATKIETPQAPSPPKPSKPAPAAAITKAAAARRSSKLSALTRPRRRPTAISLSSVVRLRKPLRKPKRKKDIEKIAELDQKMGELTTKLGPEYVALMAGLQDIDANSKDAEDIVLALAGIDKLCAK